MRLFSRTASNLVEENMLHKYLVLQSVMMSVLEMLIRLISDSQIELERVLTKGANTPIKSTAFAAKWVCAI